MKPKPVPDQSNIVLTSEQLRVIRVVLEYNHSHFVRRYLMHPGCMCPEEMVAQIASALSGTPTDPLPPAPSAPGRIADSTSA
ncbi:hypothetical protein [Stenotrophomonas maltophilia]|uniref:hypothetical protein n=1 Tax=Stenotrophomonas maltophilia TaxID=40324 RepID=UPI001111E46C|nr:hypothetical protein [Stenotrophomonas maltophilia]